MAEEETPKSELPDDGLAEDGLEKDGLLKFSTDKMLRFRTAAASPEQDCYIFTDEMAAECYQELGLSGQGILVSLTIVDEGGHVPLGQCVYMGGPEDMNAVIDLTRRLYDKGNALYLAAWMRECLGLPKATQTGKIIIIPKTPDQ